MIVSSTSHDLGQEISDHVLSDTKDYNHITSQNHPMHQMISDLNMANFSHLPSVGSDAHTGLRVGVEAVGFWAKKSEETKHIFDMC